MRVLCRLACLMILSSSPVLAAGERPRRVLLLGQTRDHPPKSHEYMAGLRVLAACLAQVPGVEVTVANADEPWPEGPGLIDRADAVVLYLGQGARWIQNDPARLRALQNLAARKGGLVALHWAIGAKDAQYIDAHQKLIGGIHGGPDRKYTFIEGHLQVADPSHPIVRGVSDMRLRDEFYYRLKFARDGVIRPILQVPIEGRAETVAWVYERPGGGRSFGFSAMHYHEHWHKEPIRRLITQAVLWTLDLPIPQDGLDVSIASRDDSRWRRPSQRTYRVPYLPEAEIRLDGRFDEAVWSRAPVEKRFRFPWKEEAAPATEFRALWDTGHLYFAFRVHDEDIVVLDRLRDEQDAVFEDRAEIYIALDDRMEKYFCVEIDSRGRVFDYRASYYRRFDPEWTWAGLQTKAVPLPAGYQIEGRFDLACLEAMGLPRLQPGTRVRCGLYRAEFQHDRSGRQPKPQPDIHTLGRQLDFPPPIQSWISWVDPHTEEPDFHVPSSLGWLEIAQ